MPFQNYIDGSAKLKSLKEATSITLSKNSYVINVGETLELNASVSPTNVLNKIVSYSTNSSFITLNNNVVKGNYIGNANVIVSTTNNIKKDIEIKVISAIKNNAYALKNNIILGLGDAIRRQFNVDFSSQKVPLPDNYTVQNGRIFKYHREAQNIYFGDGFWVEDGQISKINPDYQILCDTIVLDLKEKRFFSTNSDEKTVTVLNEEINGKKLSVRTDSDKKSVYLDDKLFMEVAKDGSQILSLNLEKTTELPNKAFEYIHLKSY